MEKKIYINPCTRVVTMVSEQLVAESLGKGTGDFDPDNMHYVKEDNNSQSRYNVWEDDWSK